MTTFLYTVTNTFTAKQYVGMTANLEKRWHQHKSANGSAPALHAAIQKYGKDSFVFAHVCSAFDLDCARDIERMLIIQHNTKSPNGYNLTDGGDGVVGRPMTDKDKDIRRKASTAYVNSLTPEERSAKFGIKGRKHSAETIEKMIRSNKRTNLGGVATAETKAKMSASQKLRPRQPWSDEVKEKIRQSLLGRKMPESQKAKHSRNEVMS